MRAPLSHRFISRLTACLILPAMLAGPVHAATAQSKASTPVAEIEQQWEYIVVSYGKTVFETPQKSLGYRVLGLSGGSEATDLESNLDIMGRFGWEVTAIVGAIGGDQQIVLKRKYDKARSAGEYGMIARGRTLYLKDLGDIIERSNRLAEEAKKQAEAERNKPRLIDLDLRDEQDARQQKFQAAEKAYLDAFQNTALASRSTISVKQKYAFSNDVIVEIRSDLTGNFLREGNSYRRKEVAAYLQAQIQQFRFKAPTLGKYDGVKIVATGFIRFNGEEVEVGRYQTSMSILDRWE